MCKALLVLCVWFGNFFCSHRTSRVWLWAAWGLRAQEARLSPGYPGLATGYSQRHGARDKSSQVEEGSRVRLRKRLKPSGIPTNRTASTSHFELTYIWVEKNSFLNSKLAKCWSANISGLIIPCTNWNIHFYSSSLKVEQISMHLDSID